MQGLESKTIKVVPGSFELVNMDSFLLLSCVLSPYRHIVSRYSSVPSVEFILAWGQARS